MKRILKQAFLAIVITGFASVPAVMAGQAFTENSGRYMMDLPDSYELTPQQFDVLYIFAGNAGNVIGFFEDGSYDLDAIYESGKENFSDSLSDLKATKYVTMEVNGKPAKLGIYVGHADNNGEKVTLFAILMGYVLDNGSLYMVSFLGADKMETWGEKILTSFYTVRESGSPLTGIKNEKPAS